jgi:serine/threonine-protein phosphatase 2A activator
MPQCGRGPRQTGPQALLFLDPKMSRFPIPYTLSEIESHSFTVASPCIYTDDDLTKFLRGTSAQGYLSFVLFLNKSVSGLSNSNATSSKPCILHLVDMLQTLRSWVEDIPPLDKDAAPQRRFGNPAYRTWAAKVSEESLGLMRALVETAPFHLSKEKIESIAIELTSYYINAFGNQTRIDYGTGHETCFVAMLYCMAKLGLLEEHDAKDIVCIVFKEYLDTVRKIQRVYCLEPAGTRGVWGLDDYQILSFLWGSSQLVDQRTIQPSSIQQMDILEEYYETYMYIGCIKFIRDMKLGPFHETSPMLHDISGVESWQKINGGMIKLYMGELLSKRQVMQHFLIGSMITL